MRPWLRGIPSVRAEVRCEGEAHLVVWRRGSLGVAHHDLAAEETLGALGGLTAGEEPACLRVVRAWRVGRTDPGPNPQVYLSAGQARVVRAGVPPSLPETLRRLRLLIPSLRLGPAGMVALDVGTRAQPGLSTTVPPGEGLAVHGEPDGAPRLARHRGRPLLVLGHRWLTHVWARELEVVDDRFVVDANTRPGQDGRLGVTVLSWDGGGPRLVADRLVPRSPGAAR